MEVAKKLIKIAKIFCNAEIVKFQKRNIKVWADRMPGMYHAPHPNPNHSYGETYNKHREFLEFSIEQHAQLKRYCEEIGITYSTSVWDIDSAKGIAALNPELIKIPSACNTDYEMLAWLCDNYSGDIHVSTGMTDKKEMDQIVNLFIHKKRNKDVVLYNCTSGYPVPFENVALLEINDLKKKYANKVKAIGFSGHHRGIAVDIAAYTLGAEYIERHYTLDRTSPGTDHAASLEPEGVRRLVRDLESVRKALNYKEKEILDIEQVQRKKLKYVGKYKW
ncbi:N-acetylneuraminate synthase family protein [Halobacillus sp. A1]|uniref:N-acetylneuraminate synthase family protein n=1 Tax=Halobacillus sp. A1 TaxID=2880262 RepID=UPI0020A6AE36|nr:N-acetylneuraminate synthase family protein [Halobacillus sp. A1]MCP3032735.1 N-acetylneuraminate synthase family protein [Halobacillus sp. A1]